MTEDELMDALAVIFGASFMLDEIGGELVVYTGHSLNDEVLVQGWK